MAGRARVAPAGREQKGLSAVLHYLSGRFRTIDRRFIAIAVIVLLPVYFAPILPIWTMRLWAPQYSEGLKLTIYAQTIRGDLQSINTLNHYVGMHAITPQDFREFGYLPLALTLFGLAALLSVLVNRRWVAGLGWLLFTVFAVYMFSDYARWLYHYGHDLDPRAPIRLPIFTPPLIGFRHMANFRVLSLPGPGTLLLGVAWLLGPLIVLNERRERPAAARAAKPSKAAHAAARV